MPVIIGATGIVDKNIKKYNKYFFETTMTWVKKVDQTGLKPVPLTIWVSALTI